jgi:hypothetical protein
MQSAKFSFAADFVSRARCAPHRAKAQRAAPFGKLGTIGFVLHDFALRAPVPAILAQPRGLRRPASAPSSRIARDVVV